MPFCAASYSEPENPGEDPSAIRDECTWFDDGGCMGREACARDDSAASNPDDDE